MKSSVLLLQSLSQSFRSLEWIFLTAYLGMSVGTPVVNLSTTLVFVSIFVLLSCFFPEHRPRPQRFLYVISGLLLLIAGRTLGIDLTVFPFIYFAKSYFLLGHRFTLSLIAITAIPWIVAEYLGDVYRLGQGSSIDYLSLNPTNPIRFLIFTGAVYIAASTFTLMFTRMLVTEQKNHERIEELSEQVESLIANLERTRIAREIHDSLGHTLTDLDMQLSVAQTLRHQNPEKAFLALDTAKLLARQCIEDVSQVLARMRYSDFDLEQALVSLFEQSRQTSTLQIHWQIDLPQLSVYHSYQIYCIVKEALMNVQKHSRASQIVFRARQTTKEIFIQLQDDGVGFDPLISISGFGIQGMKERARLLGGELELRSTQGKGTEIYLALPA